MAKLLTETADYNEPGSWGRMSEGWPEITGPKAKDYRTFAACVKSIPYGSYVWIDQGWRGAPRDALRVHIDHIETLLKDFKDAGEPTSETSVAMREKLGKLNSTAIVKKPRSGGSTKAIQAKSTRRPSCRKH